MFWKILMVVPAVIEAVKGIASLFRRKRKPPIEQDPDDEPTEIGGPPSRAA